MARDADRFAEPAAPVAVLAALNVPSVRPIEQLRLDEAVREWDATVEDDEGHVVTTIELLSDSNKTAGQPSAAFEQRRASLIGGASHDVEIDLLRGGAGFPIEGRSGSDYAAVVCPATRPPRRQPGSGRSAIRCPRSRSRSPNRSHQSEPRFRSSFGRPIGTAATVGPKRTAGLRTRSFRQTTATGSARFSTTQGCRLAQHERSTAWRRECRQDGWHCSHVRSRNPIFEPPPRISRPGRVFGPELPDRGPISAVRATRPVRRSRHDVA